MPETILKGLSILTINNEGLMLFKLVFFLNYTSIEKMKETEM